MSEVEEYFEAIDNPAVREVAEAAREIVDATLPEADCAIKWCSPTWVGEGNICSIGAYSEHANLQFFEGVELDDPDDLLEGTGKSMRHVKLRPGEVDEAAVVALLERAWAHDQG